MKVLIQWATATVNDWVEYDITNMAQVRALPKKPVPSDSSVIDDDLGWIAAVNIQGVVLTGDHVGFGIDGNGHLVASTWNDDSADWPAVPFGVVRTFGTLAPDLQLPADPAYAALYPGRVAVVNGRNYKINTVQTATPYADVATLQALLAAGDDDWAQAWLDSPALRPWSEFPNFTSNNQIHGVWLDAALHDATVAARSTRGWREWGAQ